MKGLMIIWSDRKKRQLRRLAGKGHVCYMQLSETYQGPYQIFMVEISEKSSTGPLPLVANRTSVFTPSKSIKSML